MNEYLIKLSDKVGKLQNQLEEYNRITYKKIWTDELDILEKVIHEGIDTNWTYGKNERFD